MKNKIYYLLFISVFFFSCGNGGNDYATQEMTKSSAGYSDYDMMEESTEEAVEYESDDANNTPSEPIKVTDRKIIKTGSISFETDNVAESRKKIDTVITEFGAYVSSDNENNYGNRIEQKITIRVPFAKFDKLLAKIVSGADHLDSRNIQATDVTEEYMDIQSRIENKKKLEARFTEILKEAHTVNDILNVERQIGQLREEIESAEGRLRYLANQTSLSTLTVTFYEYHESEKGFGSEFSRGFVNGWTNMVWFFVGLVNIWPFLIFIGLIIWFAIKKYKQRKKMKS